MTYEDKIEASKAALVVSLSFAIASFLLKPLEISAVYAVIGVLTALLCIFIDSKAMGLRHD